MKFLNPFIVSALKACQNLSDPEGPMLQYPKIYAGFLYMFVGGRMHLSNRGIRARAFARWTPGCIRAWLVAVVITLAAHVTSANAAGIPMPPVLCASESGNCATSSAGGYKWNPGVYIRHQGPRGTFRASDYYAVVDEIANIPNVKGLLASVFWGNLESSTKGVYNFEEFNKLYNYVKSKGLRLQVRLATGIASRSAAACGQVVPGYLGADAIAFNSSQSRCWAKLWDPEIMDHYISFLRGFGAAWDSASHLEAVVGSETAMAPEGEGYSAEEMLSQYMRLMDAFKDAFPTTNRALGFNYFPKAKAEQQIALYKYMVSTETALASPDTYPQVPDVDGRVHAPTQSMNIRTGVLGGTDYRFDSAGRYIHPALWDIQPTQMGGVSGNWTPHQLIEQANIGNAASHVNITYKNWDSAPAGSQPDCAKWLPPGGTIPQCKIGFRDFIASGAANPPAQNRQCPKIYTRGCQ